ncbi:hypothetical protein QII43_gp4 [ssRNA phage Esthiorhiza.2_46]|jgi:hypothetical protein|uniref:Uncharacterized protein n=1 Tax=ssRNA phage Esthiorhiza.2_46 TaxID=2786065 RepID=A0A8S5KXT2_9VIRU|nr:hypothetical protein QII43_gp4 [ssRNA phage Esthiorhiza.2_46]DAD49964.1 TPA_asm: hypothetical protein [ssRNA phage Esthiorhiza.2_46]
MISWLTRNKSWVLAITAGLASAPFLPGWAHWLLNAGSAILGSP